ncbi:heme-degrading domain-containing protein [Thioclava sp. FR2]|uniref:heme-degrading domain-containing protein n=1 Tax=Thioclava sp. FR2 TaxID=3445780 RepID=UPI003EBF1BC4
MGQGPDSASLMAEAAELVFPRFDETTAYLLGTAVVEMAIDAGLPVVADIRNANRMFFHAALPGSAALNDKWVQRKSATCLLFQEASLLVGTRNREKGESLAKHGLSGEDYADHGGAVPISVAGVGMVACLTVSGLPQVEDHRLAVRALRAVLERL